MLLQSYNIRFTLQKKANLKGWLFYYFNYAAYCLRGLFAILEALAESDVDECLGEHFEVEVERLVFKVVEVELQSSEHFLQGVGVAVVECGVRRHARAYGIELLVARVALHDLVDVELAFRAVADECHVASYDVPQLWELVEMMGTQKAAHARQSRVVESSVEQQLRAVFLGVAVHAAEFVDIKRLAVQAYALLPVYRRRSVLDEDCYVAGDE